MSLRSRWNYLRRVGSAYLLGGNSQLTFWHEIPEMNPRFRADALGEYYMEFTSKADYRGQYDAGGIPLLDYHGAIGLQYNPIAIAQYGLGNYNLLVRTKAAGRRDRFLAAADWLATNLERNEKGLAVWNHHFDWEYRDTLKAPWYSGLAQGQGISLLLRAHHETGATRFREAADRAFEPFLRLIDEGGVTFVDAQGNTWIEEYIVDPPTHILNGFIWATWGIYDYLLVTQEPEVKELFDRCIRTLLVNLTQFDVGFWSLYEQSGTRLRMLASPFYHQLHVVQLQVMHRLTSEEAFCHFATRWELYRQSRIKRMTALMYKGLFKLCYY